MSDLISIIVPIYNVEVYLRRCLESLVHQSYPNIEIILVNDGSKDNSRCICEEYENKYPNVKYFEKENGGLSDARNYGLERASGNLIGFIDSDDWISIDMYQTLLNDMNTFEADIATCGFATVYNSNLTIRPKLAESIEVFDRENAIRHLFDNEKYANYAWNKLYKRKLFDTIRFPVGKRMEDLGTTYKLFLKADRVSYNPTQYYKYFQRDNSILHSAKKGLYEDRLELSLERYKKINEIYPKMEENIAFFLNAAHDCLPYIDKNTELFTNIVLEVSSVDYRYLKLLRGIRRIKSLILIICPSLYKRMFKKNYDN